MYASMRHLNYDYSIQQTFNKSPVKICNHQRSLCQQSVCTCPEARSCVEFCTCLRSGEMRAGHCGPSWPAEWGPHTCCLMLLMMQLTAHVHQSWFQMPFNAAHTQKIQIHLSKQTFVMEAVCCWPGRQFPILNSEEHLVQSPRHGGEHLPPRVTAVGGFILILASLSYLLKYLLAES